MILTNRSGLPAPLVAAIRQDPYTRGDSRISATTLIGPPQIRLLKERHGEHMEEDAADRLWSLTGQLGHAILERAAGRQPKKLLERLFAGTGSGEISLAQVHQLVGEFLYPPDAEIQEQRYYAEYLGWLVSGQIDLIRDRNNLWRITDYKFTNVHKLSYGVPVEWEQQLNTYAALRRRNGYGEPGGLDVVAIFRDWRKTEARSDAGYPERATVVPVRLWSAREAEDYVTERVRLHQEAERLVDADLPHCTDEERWVNGDRYAVMKEGNKKAVRVLRSAEAAQDYIDVSVLTKKDQHSVVFRPGLPARCEGFCECLPFCHQRQAELGGSPRGELSGIDSFRN